MKQLMSDRFRGFLPVVVDVETGGFNSETDALLEIGAVILSINERGVLIPECNLLHSIIPFEGANIEQAALDITGIDPNDPYRTAIDEKEAITSFFNDINDAVKSEHCSRAVLVGHNAHFDLAFLNTAIKRNNIKKNPFHSFTCFDTATLGGLAYGQTVLAKACKSAEIEFSNDKAHSAIYDAEKTAELFCTIVNKWNDLGGWN
jgi:ribonuclease T|tara:strand:- start:3886 stop:4497 length:612 start_codon:yes stop_codon:yes gene_type:complete